MQRAATEVEMELTNGDENEKDQRRLSETPIRKKAASRHLTIGLPESKMMGEHSSYHQSIPGVEAERRLESFGRHGYLTRYSKARENYMLTVFKRRPPKHEVQHFKIIIQDNGKHRIEGKEKTFADIDELLGHYEENRIDPSFRTIGQNYTEEEYKRRSKKHCKIL